MAFSLFKKKEPPGAELIRELANALAKADSAPPPEFIAALPLAEGQTPDGALAEWYALIVAATTYALWASLGSKEKVFPILDVYQPSLVGSLTYRCKDAFLKIATPREESYIASIRDALKGSDSRQLMRLSGAMAARITGHYDEKIGSEGLQPGCLDIAVLVGLWKMVSDQIITTAKLIENLQKEVPGIFTDPPR
jgi:hypothetical protein